MVGMNASDMLEECKESLLGSMDPKKRERLEWLISEIQRSRKEKEIWTQGKCRKDIRDLEFKLSITLKALKHYANPNRWGCDQKIAVDAIAKASDA